MKRICLLWGLLLWVVQAGFACGPYDRYYLAKDYYTFRACGENMYGTNDSGYLQELRRKSNCEAWGKITSPDIPATDIEQVVYKWDMTRLQQLHAAVGTSRNTPSENRFAQWLIEHRDREVIDFLLVAKTCELARAEQNTQWYYPVEGDDCDRQLKAVIAKARSYQGSRLRARYDLQAIRAYFARHDYAGCVNYWKTYCQHAPSGFLKEMSAEYVAGSYVHLGKTEDVEKFYREQGLVFSASLKYKDADKRFDFIYRLSPDDPWLITEVQRRIHQLERNLNDSDYRKELDRGFSDLYRLVSRICREQQCQDLSKWYYAGAYLADQLNKRDEAWNNILLAEHTAVDQELKDAVHVLKIMLSVKRTARYDLAFENQLFGELQWLDSMIVRNMNAEVREKIADNGLDRHICGMSQYYWNDMMRKIVIAHVVPLCISSGFKTRALQYLNMADNRIFCLVDRNVMHWWDDADDEYHEKTVTMNQYRYATEQTDCYDYANDFFMNLDSLGVQYVQRLDYRMRHPLGEVDRFLNDRSYTDSLYFYDIIGTQMIASMRYDEAVGYLAKVTPEFNRSRNVYKHCDHNPFTLVRSRQPDVYYKLHFAEEMRDLRDSIAVCKDKNRKAELMLKYARGLDNSIGYRCWPLTSFYWGEFSYYPLFSAYKLNNDKRIAKECKAWRKKAFRTFTDSERAAQAYYDLAMFKTAVRRYPATQAARYIQGHCDELKDYR